MIPNVHFYNSGRRVQAHVDILSGDIMNHTSFQLDGHIYDRFISERGGSQYQCDNCSFSLRNNNPYGKELQKYCSPTHPCWEGAEIEVMEKDVYGRNEKVLRGKTKHPIYWVRREVSLIARINVVQVEI